MNRNVLSEKRKLARQKSFSPVTTGVLCFITWRLQARYICSVKIKRAFQFMSPRRFSIAPFLFLALWVLWFSLPVTREAAKTQWKARFAAIPTSYRPTPLPPGDNSRDAGFVRALDLPRGPERTRALEGLEQKFPDDASICGAQIVMSVDQLHLGNRRQLGPSSNPDPNWSVKLTKVETPSPETLRFWFVAANRGGKLEPNNTFWDWAKIIGLLAANRDDEIWPVLRAASSKTGYDDHANDGALARLRLAKKNGIVSPISQIATGASILFPHYATMREASRQISDDASGLRLSRDPQKHKQALEGLRDFVLMSRAMRLESKSFIGSLVGQAIEAIGLFGGSYSPTFLATPFVPRPRRPQLGSPLYAKDSRSLVGYAMRLGRPDVAAQLSTEWTELGRFRGKTRKAVSLSFLVGLSPRDFSLALAGDSIGSLLLMAIPWLLFVTLFCSLLLWLVPSWRRESDVVLSRFSWMGGVLLAMLGLLMLASPAFAAIWVAWRSPGTNLLETFLFSGSFSGGSAMVPFVWQAGFPTMLCLVFALWLADSWSARQMGKPSLAARLRAIFHPPDDDMTRFDLSPLLALAATMAKFFVLTVGVVAFLVAASSEGPDTAALRDNATSVLLGLAFVLALPSLWRLRTPQGRAFTLLLARRFAWGQLLFLSLVWGLLWMLAAPAQSRFDVQFTRQLQVGEFQIARKQLGF